jgi:hypothetical protein
MAAQIKITGWLNGIKEFDWGTTLSVSVTNRIKNQSTGEWETASRDYYDVVLNDGVTLGNIKENDQVVVEGSFKVGKTFAKKDGSTGVELRVRATSIALFEGGDAAAPSGFDAPATWTPADAPF